MTIGILGGMGSLAAAEFLCELVRAFPGEKEWDRPRTVLDNACHMPSRVRALLYGERREELEEQMAQHIAGLVNAGCTDIVLCCNTSHVFLPQVLPKVKALTEGKPFMLRHIIRILGEKLQKEGIRTTSLIATEGTIDVGIYPDILAEYDISVACEGETAFEELRFLIEAVKQNQMDDAALTRFICLMNRQSCGDVILGCTEFPLLRARLGDREKELTVRLHDPLQAVMGVLKSMYLGETDV